MSKRRDGAKSSVELVKGNAALRGANRLLRAGVPFDPEDKGLPRGLRRFGKQLGILQTALDVSTRPAPVEPGKKATYVHRPHLGQETIGHQLYKAKARDPLFMLQALGRIERGMRREVDVFDGELAHVKLLEDGVGELDFWWQFLEMGEKVSLPPALLAWATAHHAHSAGRLQGWLEMDHWIEHRHMAEEGEVELQTHAIATALSKLDWPTPKKERKRLGAYLSERIRKTHAAALELDMEDLEGGLHELRRKLRWVGVYGRALDGALILDDKAAPPKNWERYLTPAIVQSPYAKLPDADPEVEPIVLPAPLFQALTAIINDLGDVKDRAQFTETAEMGLRAIGSREKASKWLGKTVTTHHTAAKLAHAMLDQTIVTDKLLLRLADAVDAQL